MVVAGLELLATRRERDGMRNFAVPPRFVALFLSGPPLAEPGLTGRAVFPAACPP